jgi:hypothetical protein
MDYIRSFVTPLGDKEKSLTLRVVKVRMGWFPSLAG